MANGVKQIMKPKAFTRKDLIVVLGCIVFLLTNLGVIGSGGRKRAKEAVCRSNLLRWGDVFSLYTADNDGYFPPGGSANPKTCRGLWFFKLEPYYVDGKLRLCPEAVKPRADGARDPYAAWGPISDYIDDEPDGDPWLKNHNIDDNYLSYGLNDWTRHDRRTEGYQPGREGINRLPLLWRNCNVKNPNIPVLLDSSFHGSDPYHFDEAPEYNGDVIVNYNQNEMKRFCLTRHGDGINGLFMDWSVRKLGLKRLWRLRWHRQFDTTKGPPNAWPDWMKDLKDYD